ncbi:MAG: hypothetical protein OHK0057_12780 [Thermoflexibacter sp.]
MVFIKNNTLEELVGTMFNLSQGKVSQWVKALLPILEQSLSKLDCMPAKTQEALRKSIDQTRTKASESELFF